MMRLPGTMKDDLGVAGYIPLSEPYTGLGFTHLFPGGGEELQAGTGTGKDVDHIVDWGFVELRDQGDSTSVVATRSALIQRDGDVVDLDSVSALLFRCVDPGDYYIVIRHRNHLGVMTQGVVSLTEVTTSVDFTDPSTLTYGTEAQNLVSGKNVLWEGNVIPDSFLKYSGLSNDRDPILQAIGGVTPTNVVFGYYSEDVNMDGAVKYSGLGNDRDPILVNIGGIIPTSVRLEQLP